MSGIFGHLNIQDSDRVFQATVGQQVIYQAAAEYVARANAELNRVLSVFVARTTDAYTLRYKLPGNGYLQKRGPDGRYGAVKAYGSWDVAFPLEDFGAQIAGNDVAMAYMTVAELDRHIQTVVNQNVNTVRFQLMKRMFTNTALTFVDDLHGSISVQPFANGDSVTYPPVVDSDTEATEDHYARSGYATASISDTNDPIATIVSDLDEHFGQTEKVVFINAAEKTKVSALAKFTKVYPAQLNAAISATTVVGNQPDVPGTIIGFHSDGAWISQWDRITATYMVGVSLEVEPPMIRRIDPADTGLGDGLQLVAVDTQFPFQSSMWRHRFGFGAGNRLNGVILQMATAGSYDIPTAYQ